MSAMNESSWISRRYRDHDLDTLLANIMAVIKSEFYDESRHHFDFYRFALSEHYEEFVQLARALAVFDPGSIDTIAGKIAFWLNTYNALTIHAVVRHRLTSGVREEKNFFQSAWLIGGFKLTLDDIEHGILRGNRRAPRALKKPFPARSPKQILSLNTFDPRIHCAFFYACQSSPPLAAYSKEQLDSELNRNSEKYIQRHTSVDIPGNILTTSKVFDWYESDFGGPEGIRTFIAEYWPDERSKVVLKSLDIAMHLNYNAFEWRLAGTPPPQVPSFNG